MKYVAEGRAVAAAPPPRRRDALKRIKQSPRRAAPTVRALLIPLSAYFYNVDFSSFLLCARAAVAVAVDAARSKISRRVDNVKGSPKSGAT